MASPWAPLWHQYLRIFSWAIMKESGYNNTMVLQFISTVDMWMTQSFCPFNNETDALEFFHYINDKHPNITFTMETEVNHKLPFLDVLLDNSNPPSLVTSVFRKSTYTGLLTNFLSFSPFPYKLGLIRTLVDRTLQHLDRFPQQH